MKEHVKRIILAIVSVCLVILLIRAEFKSEHVTRKTNLFFIVGNEVIGSLTVELEYTL